MKKVCAPRPGLFFLTEADLTRYSDAAEAHVNLLAHYEAHSYREYWRVLPSQSSDSYHPRRSLASFALVDTVNS